MKYEVCYEAVDGTFSADFSTLEQANKVFGEVLTIYRIVPLFKMYLIEINFQGDMKLIKSFKNMKADEGMITMAKAHYSAYNRGLK